MFRGGTYDTDKVTRVDGALIPKVTAITTPTTTYVPAAPAAKTVAADTYVSGSDDPVKSVFGDYYDAFQLIKNQSEANTARQIEFANAQNDFQREQNKIAMDFNAAEAAKNRDWQEYMSNTAHQREVADLVAAGLNPVLSATGGNGAAVTSGATASGVTSAGSKAELDTGSEVALLNFLNNVMGYAMNTATAGINAGATLGASVYAADMAYKRDQDFPSTGASLLASLGSTLGQSMGYSGWTDMLADVISPYVPQKGQSVNTGKSAGSLWNNIRNRLRSVYHGK